MSLLMLASHPKIYGHKLLLICVVIVRRSVNLFLRKQFTVFLIKVKVIFFINAIEKYRLYDKASSLPRYMIIPIVFFNIPDFKYMVFDVF